MLKFLAAAVAALIATSAVAQSYPSRPVRVILPFPAAGLLEGMTRAIGQQLTEATGQPMLIENRPGASQIIGMQACAKSPPDGYTLCMATADSFSYNPHLFTSLPFDPDADFVPITNLVWIQGLIVAHAAAPFGSYGELVTFAKANPGKVNWGTWGSASIPEVYMSWINHNAGVRITPIPYKGAGQAYPALVANEVQVTYIGIGQALGHIKSGKVKPIAITGGRPAASLPQVPTLEAAGGDPGLSAWYGVFAPAKTPRAIIVLVHAELAKALKAPKVQEMIRSLYMEPDGMPPAEFAAFLKKDRANAGRVFRAIGLKPSDAPS